ncbi:hypothetical protein GcM3_151018 [Golovinomyces cichoracearum]|uniref:Uncharacterized protein n=1 Tax=Golovinomyces cichoracearum TaxID=62708 RepID=A0A420HWZ4_9PEZI|nr:hypothetical protein GcM3_151018 [Golovinomyces cichoracearum]
MYILIAGTIEYRGLIVRGPKVVFGKEMDFADKSIRESTATIHVEDSSITSNPSQLAELHGKKST